MPYVKYAPREKPLYKLLKTIKMKLGDLDENSQRRCLRVQHGINYTVYLKLAIKRGLVTVKDNSSFEVTSLADNFIHLVDSGAFNSR